jgi:hypothetical protein
MKNLRVVVVILAFGVASGALRAQEFKLFNETFQVHGFVSQGFVDTNQNNWLTMKTSDGSAAMTDGGLNISTRLTDRFRVAAQVYDRNIGQLGKWHPHLDFAYGDYKFESWMGVRVGKIKTALGLYNDTQDLESLHTWAILPQAVYPLDLRTTNLAHTGGDFYGAIPLSKGAGHLEYTAYYGLKSDDRYDGWYYSNADIDYPVYRIVGRMGGGDLRWIAPLSGLTLGGSLSEQRDHWDGYLTLENNEPYLYYTPGKWIGVGYADYQKGKWHFTSEYLHDHEIGQMNVYGGPVFTPYPYGYMGWYVSAAYRINRRLQVGAYDSQYEFLGIPATDHSFDRTATARIDLNRFWDVKIEGHFINGNGGALQGAAHGFYLFDNPSLQHDTVALVLRSGFSF